MHEPLYIFAGGATGGHLFPGVAVADELGRRERGCGIIFAGSDRPLERDVISRFGYEHEIFPVDPSTMLRRNPFRFAWRSWRACRQARMLLERDRPAAVIGLGGFAGAPVVIAASSLRIPVLLLEQNVLPGRATRWLSGRAWVICLSFAETVRYLPARARTCVTGNPVSSSIAALYEETAAPDDNGKPTLLVLGGSQGATAVNEAMLRVAAELRTQFAEWQIVHQTGAEDAERVRAAYQELGLPAVVEPFFTDLAEWYPQATLAVARAGATTLAELACAGCPAILVPYPHALRNHQLVNARAYEARGAARVVEQQRSSELTAEALKVQLAELTGNADVRAEMQQSMRSLAQPQAAAEVVDMLYRLLAAARSPAAAAVE